MRFVKNSFNLTLFFDRYNNAIAFNLLTDKPNMSAFDAFIDSLKKVIMNKEQTRTIQALLHEIPTHILVEEFSSTYLDELQKRGIEVSALLSFLQKRVNNTHDHLTRQ